MSLASGFRLHDRFLLVGRIGVGGMAEVWRADDTVLGRPVAVKVLDPSIGSDTTIRLATHREARAAAGLNHPNITRVYDYGEAALPGGGLAPYLVMELVEGMDLAERLAAGPMTWPEAALIAGQVAAGLASAHGAGVVHCDIKPGNVMLTPAGVKILDFGIAGLAGTPEGGVQYGTVGYLAPERLSGATPAPAGDVYSVGVLLAEALVGRRPESTRDLAEFPVLPGVPPALTRVGAACLAADPSARPSAAEVARVLGTLSNDPAVRRSAAALQGAAPAAPPPPTAKLTPAPGPGRAVVPAPTSALRRRPTSDDADLVPTGGSTRGPLRAAAVGGIAAAAVLIAIVIAVLANPGADRSTNGGVAQAGASPPAAEPKPTTEPPAPTTPAGIVAAFQTALDEAVDAGKIDEKPAKRINDRLDDLREAIEDGDDDVAREAGDVRTELLRDRNNEHIDELVRRQLMRVLAPLATDDVRGER